MKLTFMSPLSAVPIRLRPVSNLNLQMTNLTGHPAVIVQNGFTRKGTPTGITFIGNLFGEADLLSVAKAYQDATGFHLKHPKLAGYESRSSAVSD